MSIEFPFSRRTQWQFGSNPLIGRLDELRKEGTKLLDLTESNPSRCGFRFPSDQIIAALNDPANLFYQPLAQGISSAREAIVEYYRQKNVHVPLERIFLTSSTSEAYSFLLRLLADPQDNILVPTPSYPLFELLLDINDVNARPYWLFCDGKWSFDPESLKVAVNPQTKAMVAVHPNNPTGSFVKVEELASLNRFCHDHRLALICDEVFLDYVFKEDQERVPTFAANNSVLTFTLGGISKSLCLPQMKLAWIVVNGPEEQVQDCLKRLEMIADAYLSVNTPSQNALGRWLQLQPVITKEIMARLNRNLDFLKKTFPAGEICQALDAEGGWYGVLRLPLNLDEEEWTQGLLEEKHVFVHPGYFFDFGVEPYAVISLLTPEEILQEGCRRLWDYVEKRTS